MVDESDIMVIALGEPNTLRDRLSVCEWAVLPKIKVMGEVGASDLALLGGLAHSSLQVIDLKDAESVILTESVFSGCGELKYVALPDDLEDIPDRVFEKCRNVQSIHLPNRLDTIGDSAFVDCVKLSEIHLPKRVHLIGKESFENCSSLSTIICDSIEPPIIHENSFTGISTACQLIIPFGLSQMYKNNERWHDFVMQERENNH